MGTAGNNACKAFSLDSGISWCLGGKESGCQCREAGSVPGLGRSPGEGNGNSLQYSYLEHPMDRRAWWAIVHGIVKGLDPA